MSTIRFYCILCGTALHASSDSQHDLMECHSCSRLVPVPRPASLLGNFSNYQPVFPREVLDLTVTFACTGCGSRLRADARWEGRGIGCPDCGGTTAIPRWSTLPNWQRASEAREKTPAPAMPAPVVAKASILSAEEIDFLRGSPKPEAAA